MQPTQHSDEKGDQAHDDNEASKEPRVAIVTGSSRGIGAEIARRLAHDGLFVVVNYVSDAAAAAQVVAEIGDIAGARQRRYPPATAISADVGKKDDVRHLFTEAERIYGGADVLVASAGIQAPRSISLGETDDETFERLIGVNLRGTFYLLREASSRLRAGGRIVTLSSSAIRLMVPGQAVYSACKAGIEVMTALLAKELHGKDITVNAVAPGPTATQLFLQRSPKEKIEQLAQQTPLGRIGSPTDIARVVAFLVGSDGKWINGQTLRVNGGLV